MSKFPTSERRPKCGAPPPPLTGRAFLFLSVLLLSSAWAAKYDPRVEVSLDGNWEMAAANQVTDAAPAKARWREQVVPMLLGPPSVSPGQVCLWYRRSVEIPKEWRERRIQVVLEGADAWVKVYWNGRKLASEFALLGPVSVDVTDTVEWAAANELLVAVSSVHGDDGSDLYGRVEKGPSAVAMPLYPGGPRQRPNAHFLGLSQPVRLRALSPVRVENTFVRTSYRQRRVDVDVWIRNDGETEAMLKIAGGVEDEVRFSADKIGVRPGEVRKVTLGQPWEAARPWLPGQPNRYALSLELKAGSKVLDEHQTVFGFREMWVEGPDLFLNGRRLYLAMAALEVDPSEMLCNKTLEEVKAEISGLVRDRLAQNFNALSWWSAVPHYVRGVADAEGILVSDGLFDGGDAPGGPGQDLADLKSLLALSERFIPAAWNHPSILFWTIHQRAGAAPRPKQAERQRMLEALKTVAQRIAELDPTRRVNCDGEGDLPSGGPAGKGGAGPDAAPGQVLQSSWPVVPAARLVAEHPRHLFWLETVKGRPAWDRSRPLFLVDMNPVRMDLSILSGFLGEAVFRDAKEASALVEAEYASGVILASRVQGLSGTMPWLNRDLGFLMAVKDAQTPRIVIPRDIDSRFFSGEKVSRRFHVINGSLTPCDEPLRWDLRVAASSLQESSVPLGLKPGRGQDVEIHVAMPRVGQRTRVTLALRYGDAARDVPIEVFPSPGKLPVKGRRGSFDREGVIKFPIAVYDPQKTSLKAIQALVEGADLLTDLSKMDDPSLLVLGERSLGKKMPAASVAAVRNYAEKGGRVLILPQVEDPPQDLMPVVLRLEADQRERARSFPTETRHPVLSDLSDADLRFWRGDGTVSRGSYRKPTAGSFRILAESANERGLSNADLLQIPAGAGLFLVSQLDLAGKAQAEPVAAILVQRLVSYALNYQPVTPAIALLVASESGPCNQLIRGRYGMAMDLAEKLDLATLREYPLMVVDGTDPKALERLVVTPVELKSHLSIGNTLLWHQALPEHADILSALAGKPVQIQPLKARPAFRVRDDPLLGGLSHLDLLYALPGGSSVPGASLSPTPCRVAAEEAEELIAPGALLRIPVENGRILISQIPWDVSPPGEKESETQDRQDRYLNLLFTNLRILSLARVGVSEFFNVPEARAFLVDLRPFCNMGFRDETAGDGRGGWTDQGTNDMRNFPTWRQRFQGVPFDIVVPHKNEGRSCIVPDLTKERKPIEIPIGRKARRLFILHASVWPVDKGDKTYPVARYQVGFGDGTSATFEAVVGQTLFDWMACKKPPADNGFIGWIGRLTRVQGTPQVTVYLQVWENPDPGREIRTLTLEELTAGRPNYILVGVTAEMPE